KIIRQRWFCKRILSVMSRFSSGDSALSPSGQISALTEQMSDAWNRADAEGYGALFTEESVYIAFDGTRLMGRAANVAHHQLLFDGILRGTRLVFEGRPVIRLLSDDVAIMYAMGSVLMPWQGRVTRSRRSIQTYVVRRDIAGVWRFEAFHNSRCRPMRYPRGFHLYFLRGLMRCRTALSNCGPSGNKAPLPEQKGLSHDENRHASEF
ncbi:SgcJ/EcaC family oxidoreductase, partial [Ferrovibrio sp.]|uniref:SgcJ/EcaC family oxidoreductase n=1 Tax=Ferrovibrio sp. TaxID=1917215 RepID=UPI0035B283EB